MEKNRFFHLVDKPITLEKAHDLRLRVEKGNPILSLHDRPVPQFKNLQAPPHSKIIRFFYSVPQTICCQLNARESVRAVVPRDFK